MAMVKPTLGDYQFMQMLVHRTTVHLVERNYLTPNYLRLVLKCDDIEAYRDVPLGVNNKLFIPPQGHTEVEMPVFNPDTKIWELQNEANRPSVRTYTHRFIDLEKKELTIDFAVHDGDSVACQWAKEATVGSQVGLAMKLKHRDVLPDVKEFLFVTDMTGIPAVSALVATLPQDAKATIITEVLTAEDILEAHYDSQAAVTTEWLINPTPEKGSQLATIAIHLWHKLASPNFTHVTAEYSTVKSLRDFLRKEQSLTSQEFYACAYWQIDKKEDEEREKRLD